MRRSWTHTIEEQLLAIKGMKHNNPPVAENGSVVRVWSEPASANPLGLSQTQHLTRKSYTYSQHSFILDYHQKKQRKKIKVGSAFFSVLICVGAWGVVDRSHMTHTCHTHLTLGDTHIVNLKRKQHEKIALFLIYYISYHTAKTLAFTPVKKPKFETFRLVSLLKNVDV